MRVLRFKRPLMFARSFARDNLSYIVRHCDHKERQLIDILNAVPGTAIVYARSRKRTRELAQTLIQAGIRADFYHAGLAPEDKEEKQNRWKAGITRVMVATNAFGMGIDKPDVRVVIHHDLPSSLEEYYQEAGRAGRDGKPSYAVLLTSRTDKATLSRRLSEAFPPKDYIKHVYEMAGNFLDIAVGDGYNMVCEFDFNLFCQRFKLQPATAHNALGLLSQAGFIDFVEEISTRSRVMVLLDKNQLYSLELPAEADKVLQLLLRTYTGLFADYVYISEPLMASRLKVGENVIYQSLLLLSRMHAIHYVPRKSTPYIVYTTSREETRYLRFPLDVYERQRERLQKRIEAMKRFAFADDTCRQRILLDYFGQHPGHDCGKCDVCRGRRAKSPSQPEEAVSLERSVKYLASQPGGHTTDYIISQIGANRRQAVIDTIRDLLDRGELILASGVITKS
jgi:ATP-dependent DNA helicase RecQ